MKLTDKEAIKALNKARIYDLDQMIDDYPENERDGRSDWEMIANEAGWLLDSFNDYDTANHDALEEAKECLYRTRWGKEMPLNVVTLKPAYKEWEIREAKDLFNMYNRLVRFVQRLKAMGLYCPYC